MSDIKWIKVAVDMFEDSKIEFIRSLPEGDAIIVTWIQMLSIAGQSNWGGYLMVAEGIPYTEQLLSNKLRRQPVLLQFALETLTKLKMIDVEDGPFHISKWEKHQNVEGMEKVRLQTSERVKKHRSKEKEKLKALPSNATVTLQVTQSNATELDLDLEKDATTTARAIIELAKNETATAAASTETVMDIHQKVFGTLFMNGLMSDYVNRLKGQGLQDTFIQELMLETGEAGTKPSLRLMEIIGDRWIKEGIYTRAEAKRRRDEEKKKPTNQPSNQSPKEHVPDPEILEEMRELERLRKAN